jgi:hypothetical protein
VDDIQVDTMPRASCGAADVHVIVEGKAAARRWRSGFTEGLYES